MLSVGPTDVISGVLLECTPRRTLFMKHGLLCTIILWFIEMWKLANSLVFFSPLLAIKCTSFIAINAI